MAKKNSTLNEIEICNEINKAYCNALIYCRENNLYDEPVTLLLFNKDQVNIIEGTGEHLDCSPYLSYGLSDQVYNWYIKKQYIKQLALNNSKWFKADNAPSKESKNAISCKTYLRSKNKNHLIPDDQFNRILNWFKTTLVPSDK